MLISGSKGWTDAEDSRRLEGRHSRFVRSIMSSTLIRPFPPVLVRAGEAERLDLIGHVLLADSSATGGALSSHRVALGRGADGAAPHRHDHSSELFYILDGAFDLLVEDDVVTARTGDLLVVPPGVAHAFAAHRGDTHFLDSPAWQRARLIRSSTPGNPRSPGAAPVPAAGPPPDPGQTRHPPRGRTPGRTPQPS